MPGEVGGAVTQMGGLSSSCCCEICNSADDLNAHNLSSTQKSKKQSVRRALDSEQLAANPLNDCVIKATPAVRFKAESQF